MVTDPFLVALTTGVIGLLVSATGLDLAAGWMRRAVHADDVRPGE